MAERLRGSVEVSIRHSYADVDLADLAESMSDQQVRDLYSSRFGDALPSMDVLEEIEFELRRGKVNAALTLIEGERPASTRKLVA